MMETTETTTRISGYNLLGEIPSYAYHVLVSFAVTLAIMAFFTILRREFKRGPDPSRVAFCSAILSWPSCAIKELTDYAFGWGQPQLGDLLANFVGVALAAAPVIILVSLIGKGE